jgi:hypothetical protein
MHQATPAHTFYLDGARVIARPQAGITNGHKRQQQRENAHLLQPHWLPNTRDQRLAEKAFQNRPACSRVRCIAWMLIMASCVEATESYKPVTSVRLGVVCAET